MKNLPKQDQKDFWSGVLSLFEGMRNMQIYPKILDPEEEIKQIEKELEEINKKSNEALRANFRKIGNDLKKIIGKPKTKPDFMRQGCERVGNAMKKSMN